MKTKWFFELGVISVVIIITALVLLQSAATSGSGVLPGNGPVQNDPNHIDIANATRAATLLVYNMSAERFSEFSDWKGATVEVNTTYYDTDGRESAYSFYIDTNGSFDGYIIVLATRDNYPVLEFGKGVTPDQDPGLISDAEELAKGQLGARESLGVGRPLYLGATFFFMAYPVEPFTGRWIVVDLTQHQIVDVPISTTPGPSLSPAIMNSAGQQRVKEAETEWDQIENMSNPVITTTPVPVRTMPPVPIPTPTWTPPAFTWEAPAFSGSMNPHGVAVNSSGTLFVLDDRTGSILEFASTGAFLVRLDISENGTAPVSAYQGLALNRSGYLYTADSVNGRILAIDPAGRIIARWGSVGSGPGQFQEAYDLAVNASGDVYVVDARNYRVQVFTPSGGYITQWGGYGTAPGQFQLPLGITLDSSGNVYVGDNGRVEEFTPDGEDITGWGSPGTGPGQFTGALSLAVNSTGAIYVSDSAAQGSGRVQIFDPPGTFAGQWISPVTRGTGWFLVPRPPRFGSRRFPVPGRHGRRRGAQVHTFREHGDGTGRIRSGHGGV